MSSSVQQVDGRFTFVELLSQ